MHESQFGSVDDGVAIGVDAADGGNEPIYPPTATPPATDVLVPPQSPSGSVTGESATSNYLTGETSTQTRLSEFGESETQQGSPAVNAPCSFNSLNPANFQTFRWE